MIESSCGTRTANTRNYQSTDRMVPPCCMPMMNATADPWGDCFAGSDGKKVNLCKKPKCSCKTKANMCERANERQCKSKGFWAMWNANTPATKYCKWTGTKCVHKPTLCEQATKSQCTSSSYNSVWGIQNADAKSTCEWTCAA